MEKQQWQNLYNKLDQIQSDYLLAYQEYTRGKNKKLRDVAEKRAINLISLTISYLKRNPEALELLFEGDKSEFGQTIIFDEFKSLNYFGRDMSELLYQITHRINSLE